MEELLKWMLIIPIGVLFGIVGLCYAGLVISRLADALYKTIAAFRKRDWPDIIFGTIFLLSVFSLIVGGAGFAILKGLM